ncbi:MAG: outer membrane beta-barrel protein [Burkholderiaceae bacterium]|nr:outer membrane beta-barrel protein [Burkholderiaceae bacterium]
MTDCRNRDRLSSRTAVALAAITTLAMAGPATAETSPWYLGISQSFGYESNLYRIADDQRLPDGQSRSDTVSVTSLIGGIDQPIGRQRVYGSLDYGINRYANNDDLNNESYGLKLALDWETLERLSGTFRIAADQALTQFNNLNGITGRVETQKNIVNTELAHALFRLGRKTQLSFEAGLGYRQRSYSATGYADEEFDETSWSLGARYRPSTLLELGASIRQAVADYPNYRLNRDGSYETETVTRRYLDFTARWVPNALSQLDLRVSPTRITHEKNPINDFSGLTGSANWTWQATGKTRLHTTLWRDAGQSGDAVDLGIYGPGVNDTSTVTTALRVRADHDLTGKVGLYASLDYAHRLLNRTVVALPALTLVDLEGHDNTTTAALGVRWAVTRAGLLGCEFRSERRSSSNQALSVPFDGYGFSCFGQIVLQ